ncbi:MAG: pyridoxal-phosphate dependent enzyme [Infirmifilum sp.]
MAPARLKCPACGREYPLSKLVWRCECGSPLRVDFPFVFEPLPRVRGMWRYRKSLPLAEAAQPVTLGEGGTATVKAEVFGLKVFFKLEFLNPTGSFKDRGSSLTVSNLKAIGATEIAVDSSGNAGASIAAYSSLAGIKCRVYTPASAPQGKKAQIRIYGAELIEVEGSRGDVTRRALSELRGAFYASHLWSPFFPEANATIAYEFFEDYGVPDAVIAPVGSGGLLLGLAWGFERLFKHGFSNLMPRVYAVQSASNPTLHEALYGRPFGRIEDEVLADGIAVQNPPRLGEIVEVLKKFKGGLSIVNNKDIIWGLKTLAKMGLFVEPTSATIIPALRSLVESGDLASGESVLAPLTGFGFKAFEKIMARV